ncbi:hypothetical protein [Cupriavidus basilensis]|uniref:Uncharacterized protein n=1 Tax=Cupriavidus basilensis TaxID=68895 RepID=A0A0C4YAX9_9BURK|nr:hypothetical protein [Cupriavidus basilensis]AJG20065.1 hypothetical protein RR42_m2680 [Cupriavidus basilensis]
MPNAERGAHATRRRQWLIVVALVLVAHGLVLGPVPWPARQASLSLPRQGEQDRRAMQWVAVLPFTRPPTPAATAKPAASSRKSQALSAPRPERASAVADRAALATRPGREPVAAMALPPGAGAPFNRSSAAGVPMLPLAPMRSADPASANSVARDNIARSRQRGEAVFERAASDAMASPAQRLAAGVAAAAQGEALVESQVGTNRTARVRSAAGTYCLRMKDPSLKVDPFRQELALPANCPP